MNVDEIANAIPDLTKEAAELRVMGEKKMAEGQAYVARAMKIESLIVLVQSLSSPGTSKPETTPNLITDAAAISQNDGAERLSGIPAIRKVMREDPQRIWTAKEMFEELSARDWTSKTSKKPKHSVETGMGRMSDTDEIHRVSTGRFRYGPQPRVTVADDLGNAPSTSAPAPEQALPGPPRERSGEALEIVGAAGSPGVP
jgi:hypothetical protein